MKLLDLFCDDPAAPVCGPVAADGLVDDVNPTRYPKTTSEWLETCPDYWRGCPFCPDADLYHYGEDGKPYALNSQFCKRHVPPQRRFLQ